LPFQLVKAFAGLAEFDFAAIRAKKYAAEDAAPEKMKLGSPSLPLCFLGFF